jgi:hypothetical protein
MVKDEEIENYNHHDHFKFSSNKISDYAPNLQIEPKHLIINLNFEKWLKREVKMELQYKMKVNQEHDEIQLNGENFYEVSVKDITKEEVTNKMEYDYDGSMIRIVWEKKLNKNEERDIIINYIVKNPITGMIFSHESSGNYQFKRKNTMKNM